MKEKLGVALVGLGRYSSNFLAPALLNTKKCYLAGVVTNETSKAKAWAKKYQLPPENIYDYQNFDSIANNNDIDIVYIVLPVSLHKEFTIRAANAGKHVICEKPMAMNVKECEEMIAACKQANRQLSIGYRLHFEPYNQEMMRLGQQKVYGRILSIHCEAGFVYTGDPDAWRLNKSFAGGGSLMDMGIYAIQGARYITGEEPVFVTAREIRSNTSLFRDTDEAIHFELEFPSGCIAYGISSYAENLNLLKAIAEKGEFELTAAYLFDGMAGNTPRGAMNFPQINQQAAQMDDFADCILHNKPSRVPGEMGLQDIRIIETVYRSIQSGKKEMID